ncbi:MAG: YihY/virulence factor BrkB family protein [Acidobacteriaceae bacterium]
MSYSLIKTVLKGTYDGILRNHLLILAAGLSYFLIVALFPGLALLSVIASYLPIANASSRSFAVFNSFMPSSQVEVISNVLDRAVAPNRDALLSVGVVGTLWAASSVFACLKTAIGVAYGAPDGRSYWRSRLIAIELTVTVGILLLIAFGVLTVGPHFGNWLASRLGLSEVIAILWPYVRWAVAVVFAVVSVETLYFISPKKEQRFLETLPGAILAVSGWIVLTYFLGSYFRNRSTQNTVYGSLAGAIAFMVWLCWAGFVVLVGAQLNAEIEKVRHRWGTRSAKPLRPPAGSSTAGSSAARRPNAAQGCSQT